jgi:ABC-2 type transport system ATP-binding protein
MFIVETKDLTKNYGSITAVDGLNLRIEEGDIFGFLGSAFVAGYNTTREPLKVKRITGYVPEKVGFYEDLTAAQNLVYTARLNGLSDRLADKRATEALDIVGLPRAAERNVSEFSRGMKQRLAIADILIKQPKIAIMDEPTSGIDPEGIVQVLDLIAKIAKETKMTIVMSSHQLYQVQRICNRVGILMDGRLVAEGLLEELSKEAMGGSQFRIEVKLTEITEAIVEAIKQISGVLNVEQSPDGLTINCSEDLRPQIAKKIVDTGGLMIEMKIQSYALEDIYLKYFREG